MAFDLDAALQRALQPLNLIAEAEISQAQFNRNRRLTEEDRVRREAREDKIRAEGRANQLSDESRERQQQLDDAAARRKQELALRASDISASAAADLRRERADKTKREDIRADNRKEFYRQAGYTPDDTLSPEANDAAAIASGTAKFKNLLSAKAKFLQEIESLLEQGSTDAPAAIAKSLANDPTLLAEKLLSKQQMEGLVSGIISPADLIQALPKDKAGLVAERYQELLKAQADASNTLINQKARLRLAELQSKTDGLNAAIQNLARQLPAASLGDAFATEEKPDGSRERDPALQFIESKPATKPAVTTPEFEEPDPRPAKGEALKREIEKLNKARAAILGKIKTGSMTISGPDFGDMSVPYSPAQFAKLRNEGRAIDTQLDAKQQALAALTPLNGPSGLPQRPGGPDQIAINDQVNQLSGADLSRMTPQEQLAIKEAALSDGYTIEQMQEVVNRVRMGDPQALKIVGQYVNRVRSQRAASTLQPLSP